MPDIPKPNQKLLPKVVPAERPQSFTRGRLINDALWVPVLGEEPRPYGNPHIALPRSYTR